ncbi:MAG TPA: hypothetical protein VH437_04170 [Terriglobales bacterium]
MSESLMNSSAVMVLVAIPREVSWCYLVFGVVLAIGMVAIFLRGAWQTARGIDKLMLFGPIFYAAPLAAFGTEHFTLTKIIASLIPAWIPWHIFLAYFIGTCFILAGLSLVTGIQARVSASLLALTFFLFVVLMDIPGWLRNPGNRIAMALVLRELSFSAGALALAVRLSEDWPKRGRHIALTFARCSIAIGVLFYSVEQFMHADHVPGIPLEMVTPQWVFGHAVWTYLVAVVYLVAGPLLLAGKKTRATATCIGVTVLFVELVVYVPIAVVGRASLESFNYLADTLMYCGTVLLLAGAMPREEELESAALQSSETGVEVPLR